MAHRLWHGNLSTRLRTISGLVLFIFAFFHFFNIGMGLISTESMESMQRLRAGITRNPIGRAVLLWAIFTHMGLAVWSIAVRQHLRFNLTAGVQLILGLLIPLQLIPHVVHTSISSELFNASGNMPFFLLRIWNSPDVWKQSALLLVVWVHSCIGLHMWLRHIPLWQKSIPYLIGISVLIPGFAFAGLITEGRTMADLYYNQGYGEVMRATFYWPSREEISFLEYISILLERGFLIVLVAAIAIFGIRYLMRLRRSVRIQFTDGPEITAETSHTLLEMSQQANIAHAALCGGKGRCTTCRVAIIDGAETLPAPSPAEARALQAVGASPSTRLACQIHPTAPLTVTRIYHDKDQPRGRGVNGQEKPLAVMFLDIRGFTARTTDLLPYDVVFLLNRFFDAIVPQITNAGGTVDKYMGDGLLAVFETGEKHTSARCALKAVQGIGQALDAFNTQLTKQGDDPIRIGIGLHLGMVVLGEIGAASHAPRTLIGATVNAASRLETRTKDLGVEALISRDLIETAGISLSQDCYSSQNLRGVEHPIDALATKKAAELTRILEENTIIAPQESSIFTDVSPSDVLASH